MVKRENSCKLWKTEFKLFSVLLYKATIASKIDVDKVAKAGVNQMHREKEARTPMFPLEKNKAIDLWIIVNNNIVQMFFPLTPFLYFLYYSFLSNNHRVEMSLLSKKIFAPQEIEGSELSD